MAKGFTKEQFNEVKVALKALNIKLSVKRANNTGIVAVYPKDSDCNSTPVWTKENATAIVSCLSSMGCVFITGCVLEVNTCSINGVVKS